ncbi:hypothetical protein Q5P01_021009 [Channa striata]|uniref:Uncharacterized protein n=1 Tax=Channa striata TaxID=64152 RepID=A0AA88S9N8_CHASR|nr:hypothetical protein Q5P01_021009 [Channa striata]
MASSCLCSVFPPQAQRERERESSCFSRPSLCSVIFHILHLRLLPEQGEHHTLSANESMAPPSPSHHLSFQVGLPHHQRHLLTPALCQHPPASIRSGREEGKQMD